MHLNIVAKFGGTSVKTESSIRRVAQIIAGNPNIRVVVVSAVGGITNMLVDFCQSDPRDRLRLIQEIAATHLDLIQALDIIELKSELLNELKRLDEVRLHASLTAQEIDHVIALGEDLSSLIVTRFFQKEGISAAHLDARTFLKTDAHFGKAMPNVNKIKTFTFPKGLSVTQGFIGSTDEGITTTLGRGGSDYSAALIAEAIHAHELLIYTDVPGVYTTDPNIVNEARLIPELNFQEMAEMANFGAKILHPATLEPCVRTVKVPVRILSTFEPDKKGTFINVDEERERTSSTIQAITMRKGQILVTIKSLKMLNAYGFLANIFGILAKYKIGIDLITTSEVSVALTIDRASMDSPHANPFLENEFVLQELEQFAEVVVEDHLTLVAVIGSGLTIPGVIQRTLSIIEPYAVRLVCYGASHSSISFLVQKEAAPEIVKMLHQQLLGNDEHAKTNFIHSVRDTI